MNMLASVVPELVAEVERAMTSGGRGELAPLLASGVIERCTCDASADAGYIYLVRPAQSLHFAKLAVQVAETIPFLESGFNVDVDHDGYVYGIEILSRADVFSKLRDANAL